VGEAVGLAYLRLVKTRIVIMVLVACAIGLLLASGGRVTWGISSYALLGTALLAGGACALNEYLEREADGLMERTRRRPLPAGAIPATNALAFGILLVLAGCAVLVGMVNMLTAFLGLLSAFLYVLVYTPVKRLSWLCTSIGAIPGAIPPMVGWAAATNRLEPGGWLLFAMIFLWQLVHFYEIAWMFRDAYRAAGFRMLPVVDPSGKSTLRQIVLSAAALLPASLLLAGLGPAGTACCWGALLAGAGMLAACIALFRLRSRFAAHAVVLASICYLPIMLGMILVDLYL
jgi:protoheme IX farnesyltransferase